jgi:hypothetical protein
MKSFIRLMLPLLGTTIACAVGLTVFLVLLVHVLSGEGSPGLIAVARNVSRAWGPLIWLLLLLWFLAAAANILWKVTRQAKAANLSVSRYLDLSAAEKVQLREGRGSTD